MYEPYPYKLSKIKISILIFTFLALLSVFAVFKYQLFYFQLNPDLLKMLSHLVYFLFVALIVLSLITFRKLGATEFFFIALGLLFLLIFKLIHVQYFNASDNPATGLNYFLFFNIGGGFPLAMFFLLAAFNSGKIIPALRRKGFIFQTTGLAIMGNIGLYFLLTTVFFSHPVFSKYNLPIIALIALINLLLFLAIVFRFTQLYFKSPHSIYFYYTMAALFFAASAGWFLFSQFIQNQMAELAQMFQFSGLIFLMGVYFVENSKYLESALELRSLLEKNLSKNKQELQFIQKLIDGLATGICSIDQAENIEFVNQKLLAIFNHSADLILKKNIQLLFGETGFLKFQLELEKVKAGAATQFEVEMKHKSGKIFPVLINAAPDFKGLKQYAGCRLSILEISDKKEKERQLKDYSENLELRIKEKTTDLQQKTHELNQAKRYYETLISGMLDILLVVDRQGNCNFINLYGKNLLGYEAKQLTSKRLPDFFADMERLQKNYGNAMKVELRDYETPVKTKAGKTILCNWNVRYLFDSDGKNIGAMCVGRDVTEQKAMQEKLEEHSLELEKLVKQRTGELKTHVEQLSKILKIGEELALDMAPAQILASICNAIKSSGWQIVIFSMREKESNNFKIAAYAGLTQRQIRKFVSEHNFLYKDVFKFVKDEFLVSKSYLVKRQASESEQTKWQPEDMLIIPVKFKTNILGFFTVFSPANKKRPEMQQIYILETFAHKAAVAIENRRLFEETKSRARELAQVNQIKTDFFTTMSHELRTPLNSIISLTDVLLKQMSGVLNNEQIRQIQIVRKNGSELLKLINNILDLSKINAGKMEVTDCYFPPAELIQESLSRIQPLCERKKLKLESKIDKNLPKYVFSDEDKISRILTNLLGNAVKFTQRGKIRLTVDFNQKASQLQLTVADTGSGMTKAEQERLFKSYSRSENADRKKYEGSGLGLSITKKMVELMRGSISAESKPGKGSTFLVNIPIKDFSDSKKESKASLPNADKNLAPLQTKNASGKRGKKQKLILLVDDNLDNQYAVNFILEEQGHKVLFAENGARGIKLAAGKQPDLILMDMMMPEVDGYQATREIRQIKKLSRVPIVAMTAKTAQEDKKNALKAGCDDYLTKPFTLDEILEKVQKWLGENND